MKKFVQYAVLIIFALVMFMPLYIMIVISFKNELQTVSNFWWFSFPMQFKNYVKAWNTIVIYFYNSIKVTTLTVVGIMIVSTLAGYAFAKLKFKGKEFLFYTIMAFRMIPTSLLLIPMFINLLSLNLNNSHFGIILPNIATGSVIAILLARGFFESIPDSLFESAKLDGANELRILTSMVLPLSKPILGTIAVYNFFGTFNQFIWPYIVLSDDKLKTIPIGLERLAGQYGINFGLQMAGYTLASLPIIIIFILTMRLYVSGITAGAVKA